MGHDCLQTYSNSHLQPTSKRQFIAYNIDLASLNLLSILSPVRVTHDSVLGWILDLLTTYRSQLQITLTVSLNYTFEISL
jgi:hypothetical protein